MKKNKVKDTFFSKNRSLNCRGKLVGLDTPKVMGILNITPDSFYDGGHYNNPSATLDRAGEMLDQGADIIDVGAVSSRPGASEISDQEEQDRLHPVISLIRENFPDAIISIDTYRSSVVKEMLASYEIDMINDISAGEFDENMIPTIIKSNIPYIIMHMQGNPGNMQDNPVYENVTDEIIQYFSAKINFLHKKGIADILIDPGFGFGKTLDQNYDLLGHSYAFQMFELPVVAGISRKSMIYKLLNTNSENALNGTTAAHMILLNNGVNILRVHDVKEAKQAIHIHLAANKTVR
ncbi:MAG: dihydropteroate synthase [Bacteroidales bacterium]|nr:dihydropteroate synthase [Bacteroidales bacterium]